jgi:monoamine oxidase
LTGLSIARALQADGVSFRVIEARNRLGGRIKTESLGADWFDLGPSWFWPGQPRMAALIEALGLEVFEQFSDGALLYETERGDIVRDRGHSSMQGSLRVRGGMGALVSGLARGLPKDSIVIGEPVISVSRNGTLGFADGGTLAADLVVLALPPRVAANLRFEPALATPVSDTLRDIPTWMAGHAKFVAVYEGPFWRGDGLSGDAMSRVGPMVEIHDATPDTRGALFGFLGVPAHLRAGRESDITAACVAQLERLFGPEAKAPLTTFYTDWASQPATAVQSDRKPLMQHPAYGRPAVLNGQSQNAMFFASTELASEMGGVLEGALSAAEDALAWVKVNLTD